MLPLSHLWCMHPALHSVPHTHFQSSEDNTLTPCVHSTFVSLETSWLVTDSTTPNLKFLYSSSVLAHSLHSKCFITAKKAMCEGRLHLLAWADTSVKSSTHSGAWFLWLQRPASPRREQSQRLLCGEYSHCCSSVVVHSGMIWRHLLIVVLSWKLKGRPCNCPAGHMLGWAV